MQGGQTKLVLDGLRLAIVISRAKKNTERWSDFKKYPVENTELEKASIHLKNIYFGGILVSKDIK